MILYIIFGSLLFACVYFFVKYIIDNSASTNITTTSSIPPTTQNIITTTTSQPKGRKIFFQAGQGGIPIRVNDIGQAPGGAGGILIDNQGPLSQTGYVGLYNIVWANSKN